MNKRCPSALGKSLNALSLACVALGLLLLPPTGSAAADKDPSPQSHELKGGIKTADGYFLTVRSAPKKGAPSARDADHDRTALRVEAKTAGPSEFFTIENLGKREFALKTPDGHYLSASGTEAAANGSETAEHARSALTLSKTPNAKTRLIMTEYADNRVTLRTPDGRYLTAVNGGGVGGQTYGPLKSDAAVRGAQEIFTWNGPLGGGDLCPICTRGGHSPNNCGGPGKPPCALLDVK